MQEGDVKILGWISGYRSSKKQTNLVKIKHAQYSKNIEYQLKMGKTTMKTGVGCSFRGIYGNGTDKKLVGEGLPDECFLSSLSDVESKLHLTLLAFGFFETWTEHLPHFLNQLP